MKTMSMANVSPYKWCKKWYRVIAVLLSSYLGIAQHERFHDFSIRSLTKYICYLILSVVQKSPHINYRLEFAQEPTPIDC
mgnify:FL=1